MFISMNVYLYICISKQICIYIHVRMYKYMFAR